ncbi:MAG: Type IV leader peptidase family protein [Pelotomaculum sp. PtaB.Bin013]|uniref:Prepilin peptidase n=1 Tax=Pelotomaculum isophthalicicum JI TaxID=947010 RepID=A0A9X4H4P1_9FIRM|nr:prepilin peptidase [Pelotomaculum isophthalicicum]MDF9406929.1 prepilin peptidase [Pelotomaculum isophthalicicum JI]OPX82130.1 MAG: Type IV leader peptidase family protein [Pelotomaculum sp. PtaB.Bin013]
MFIDTVFFLLTVTCLCTDLAKRKIYNFVLLPAVLVALGYHLYTGGLPQVILSLEGLSLGLALLLIPHLMGGIGAGDVKFLAAIGALKGPSFIFITFLAGAIAGGILAIFYLVRNKKLLFTIKKLFLPFTVGFSFFQSYHTDSEVDQSSTIPYGAAIALGSAIAYFVR